MTEELSNGLRKLGCESFRPGQEQIVMDTLDGKDTLNIMPTGAGKSLCYQLPATLLPGITIVVSPLIALMRDQVTSLNQKKIPAAFINSTLRKEVIDLILKMACDGKFKIIYVAPERLTTAKFLEFAKTQDISLLVVDEAHCVTQWGLAFRQAYQTIPTFVNELQHRPVIAAFTATATQEMQKEITEMLSLDAPVKTVTGFDRPNLFFDVIEMKEPKEKYQWLKEFVKKRKGQCGVVYCRTRRTTQNVTRMLRQAGISAQYYHAGLTPEQRKYVQDCFVTDNYDVLASTTAFGMGIDKPNVRYVVHFDMPLSIEDYYQQAGRAGRDGKPAECILLHNSEHDMAGNLWLLAHSDAKADEEIRSDLLVRDTAHLEMMERYAELSQGKKCFRKELLEYFGEKPAKKRCGNCGHCRN